jgi:regulator of protease activity HflC (stomatin/prohibitin superfamily)
VDRRALGKFHAVLEPGLNFVVPFVDRIAYRHDLREIPLDVPPQVCITKDNTQLQVDGILYFRSPIPGLPRTAPRITSSRSRNSRRRHYEALSAEWNSIARSRSATRSTPRS